MLRQALVPAIFALAGCTHTIRCESEPPGASVFVDGKLLGRTPLTCDIPYPSAQSFTLRMELDGYRPAVQVVRKVPTGQTVSTTSGGTTTTGQAYVQGSQRQYNPSGPTYTNATVTGTTVQDSLHTTTTSQVFVWPDHFHMNERGRAAAGVGRAVRRSLAGLQPGGRGRPHLLGCRTRGNAVGPRSQ